MVNSDLWVAVVAPRPAADSQIDGGKLIASGVHSRASSRIDGRLLEPVPGSPTVYRA